MTTESPHIRQLDPAAQHCPVTGLPLVRLPAFTNVELAPSLFVSLTRIGDHILHSHGRGALKDFDYGRFMALADDFCKASGMHAPVVHFYELFEYGGRITFGSFTGISRYFVDHQHDIIGLIVVQQPSWLQPFIAPKLRLFHTPFQYVPVPCYSDGIVAATDILNRRKHAAEGAVALPSRWPISFNDVRFDPRWEFYNPKTDFKVRNGIVPGRLLFVSLRGRISEPADIIEGLAVTESVTLTNQLTGIPAIIVDYSELKSVSSLRLRRLFAREVQQANEKCGNLKAVQIIINPDRFNRIAIQLLAPFTGIQFRIVDTVDEAFDAVNALTAGKKIKVNTSDIRVRPKDIEEISNAMGMLQWVEDDVFPAVKVSPSNPLGYLIESLEMVQNDISDMRQNERLAQEKRLKETEEDRQRLLDTMRETEAARAALLREQEERRILLDHIPIQIWYLTDETTYGAVNRAHADFVGITSDALAFGDLRKVLSPEMADALQLLNREVFSTGRPLHREVWIPHRSGLRCLLSIQQTPHLRADGTAEYVVCSAEDITDRRQAEAEHEKLQEQLTQSQKMESVGRLAGGVAHDFNNMLSVILNNTEIALESLSPENPLHEDLTDIKEAANRSAELIGQLLAFARKQTISPRVVQLNDTVEGMLKMLGRLIGEDIELVFRSRADLWSVKIDPGQVDQILANLCINARDAIKGVGRVVIEIDHFTFDSTGGAAQIDLVPGEYVLLSISDDGCGMDSEMQPHLFEPFFTTKEQGKGTGLGLATVYGIVKQNRGTITVHSEPGKGATFRIYLPRYLALSEAEISPAGLIGAARGNETVLVVEDEATILKVIRRVLDRLGYRVISAGTPEEAVEQMEIHGERVQLLLTDVIMPGMNGRDLMLLMTARYPNLRCLFMSGYTADVIAHHGVLENDVHFIQKPFSVQDLATKIRDVLARK